MSPRPTPPDFVLPLAASLALLAGCADAPRDADDFVRHDSAGVWVAESHAPVWREGDGWTLSPEPLLEIGVMDGAPEYAFAAVTNAIRLSDGRILVGDRLARDGTLRYFGPDGEFLLRAGPAGEGPGEIGRLASLGPYRGDSIWVWDPGNRRLGVLDPGGGWARTVEVDLSPATPGPMAPEPGTFVVPYAADVLGAFGDGSFVAHREQILRGHFDERGRPDLPLHRYAETGEPLAPLGAVPGQEFLVTRPSGGPSLPPPFPGAMVAGVRGERLYVGAPDRFEIRVLGPDGEPEGLIRRVGVDLTLTDADHEAWRADRRRALEPGADAQALERALADVRFPPIRPPFDRLRIDAAGHLWVREYPGYARGEPGPDVADGADPPPRRWHVLENGEGEGGRWLGIVEVPARLDLSWIGEDLALGVYTDRFDVPYIRLYTLRRD